MTEEAQARPPVAGVAPAGGPAGERPDAGAEVPAPDGAPDRLKTLEASLADESKKSETLGRSLKEVESQLSQARNELGQATEHYRKVVFSLHQDIPAELITGSSIPEIDASVQKAVALVEKIKESLIRPGKTAIPAGAPARSAPDYAGLSPRDKIKVGIGQRQR